MAEFDMFGPMQGGQRQAIIDTQAQQLQRITMGKEMAQMQEQQALAAKHLQETALAKQQAELKQKQQEYLQKVALQHAGESTREQADAQLKAGFLIGAAETNEKNSQILSHLATVSERDAQAEDKREETKARVMEEIGQVAQVLRGQLGPDGVVPADKMNRVYDAISKSTGITFSEEDRKQPMTAEKLEQLTSGTKAYKEKHEEFRKAANEKRLEEQTRAVVAKDNAETALAYARAAREKELTTSKAKAGSGTVRTPKEDVKTVLNMIGADYKDISADDPGAAATAELVAADAQDIIAKNRGISRGQALQQAYAKAKKAKMISETTEHKRTFSHPITGEDKKTAKFNPRVTREKPAGASDEDWAAYKKDQGIE